MATKVLWYSEAPDDPTEMRMVLDRAEDHCHEQKIGFNQLVNAALRKHLGLPALDLAAAKEARSEARKARLAEARAAKQDAKVEKERELAAAAKAKEKTSRKKRS